MSGILIVDDDDQARVVLARALKEDGLESVSASSVDGAMELIQSLEPDVILLNASLGPQSALLMQRALRSGGRQAPAVVFTRSRDDDTADIVARVRLAMDRSHS
jgi:DNA-binding response OmpR family regulator